MAEEAVQEPGTELVEVVTAAAAVAELDELEDRSRQLASESRSASTWRAYDSDLRQFQAWCSDRQLEPLPADPLTLASYLAALEQTHRPSTIRRRLASISVAHQMAGFETPTADAGVRAVWSGIRRRHGIAPRKVKAARTKLVTTMVAPLGHGLADVRDRALLLMGFAGALRRSELVALDCRGHHRRRRRTPATDPQLQDRPRRRIHDHRTSVRLTPRHLSGTGLASVAYSIRHQQRAGLPRHRPTWPHARDPTQ